MKLIGLTGGIACGKSTVSQILSDAGFVVIDCDRIAKQVVKKGRWGYRRVLQQAFPGKEKQVTLANGELDREAIAKMVFNDSQARRRMNHATHLPVLLGIVREVFIGWILCKQAVVIDMPLLFETGFYKVTKGNNVLVICDSEIQLQRLMKRDGMDEDSAKARIAAQMPQELKISRTDHVLRNDDMTKEELAQETISLFRKIEKGNWVQGLVTSPVGVFAGIVMLWNLVWS